MSIDAFLFPEELNRRADWDHSPWLTASLER